MNINIANRTTRRCRFCVNVRNAIMSADVNSVAPSSVFETVVTRQRLATIAADLRDLPEQQRGALVMHELCGLSHAEIGSSLGISDRAAKQAVFEARTALVECEDGREAACDAIRRVLSDADGRVLRARRTRSHLRYCVGCRDYRSALARHPSALAALAPPLPIASASALLHATLQSNGQVQSGSVAVAGVASSHAVVFSLVAKSAVGAVLVIGTGAGVTRLLTPDSVVAHRAASAAAAGFSKRSHADRVATTGRDPSSAGVAATRPGSASHFTAATVSFRVALTTNTGAHGQNRDHARSGDQGSIARHDGQHSNRPSRPNTGVQQLRPTTNQQRAQPNTHQQLGQANTHQQLAQANTHQQLAQPNN